jgi:hypothetical protein
LLDAQRHVAAMAKAAVGARRPGRYPVAVFEPDDEAAAEASAFFKRIQAELPPLKPYGDAGKPQ